MKKKRKRYRIRIERLAFSFSIISMLLILIINGFLSLINAKNNKVNDNTLLVNSKPSLVVCIDPGHGTYDTGAKSFKGVLEKNIVLNVGLKVGQILEKNNVKVVYTRKDDKTVLGVNDREDLKKRVEISDESKAQIFISIHCNSYKDSTIRGIELWCNEPNSEDEQLAKTIEEKLYKLDYTEKRGIRYQKDSPLYVLKNNKAISALVELGYLTNEKDSEFISSDSGQAKCAEAIAKAVLEFKNNIN